MTSAFLVPSQVVVASSSQYSKNRDRLPNKSKWHQQPQQLLIPSQVKGVPVSRHMVAATTSSPLGSPSNASVPSSKLLPVADKAASGVKTTANRRRSPRSTATNNTERRQKNKKNKRQKSPSVVGRRQGNLPDIFWGSISMEHLRQHPSFVPLPLPKDVPPLTMLEDARLYRQDSWQWDTLHDGRCTTSQAVAALGFLEPQTGALLGIPSSWQRGGSRTYERLRQDALRTLHEMNVILIEPSSASTTPVGQANANETIWGLPAQSSPITSKNNSESNERRRGSKIRFAAKFNGRLSIEERQQRRNMAQRYAAHGLGLRMMWGNAQEATSILTALNFFTHENSGVVLKEIGMCGAGLDLPAENSTLLVGASPDAVIVYPDGREEALEVKNHCPFVPCQTRGSNKNGFQILELPFAKPYIFPLYVPQMMLEMLCIGPRCQSAVMVRQTATNGALIVRMHRDDAWIEEMLYWLNRFQTDFVEPANPPPSNFFLKSNSEVDQSRYLAFLERTKELTKNVEVVGRVPASRIQRCGAKDSLFLD